MEKSCVITGGGIFNAFLAVMSFFLGESYTLLYAPVGNWTFRNEIGSPPHRLPRARRYRNRMIARVMVASRVDLTLFFQHSRLQRRRHSIQHCVIPASHHNRIDTAFWYTYFQPKWDDWAPLLVGHHLPLFLTIHLIFKVRDEIVIWEINASHGSKVGSKTCVPHCDGQANMPTLDP